MGLVTFIIVLSVMIFIHEMGHFLAARYFGVKVYIFSIGFGKKIYSKIWKGTEWKVALIPLGGYVQMKGQDDTKPTLQDNSIDSYNTKKPWQRIIILFAGPFANFLLAAVLFFSVGLIGSTEIAPKIGQVLESSPAKKYGLKVNDEIVSINHNPVKSWNELSTKIKNSNESVIYFEINRNGQILNLAVVSQISDSKNIFGEPIKQRMIGIAPASQIISVERNFSESLQYSIDKTYEASKMIFLGIQKLLSGVVPSSEVGGVISIGKVISDASEVGIVALFMISALISVNLGVLNLLPIPALDGGHIMFNLYEIVTKRKPNEKILLNLTIGGWVILGCLMVLGLYNDINRLIG
jgi:regulator of sigma E protease